MLSIHEAIIPGAVSSSTPLPAVLTTIDPRRFPTLSQARKSLRRGFVLINGVRSGCGSTASPGDVVALQERVAVGAAQQRGTAPFPLDIVYEDDSLGIVVKPAGVCTHPPKDGDPATHRRRRRQHDAHGRPAHLRLAVGGAAEERTHQRAGVCQRLAEADERLAHACAAFIRRLRRRAAAATRDHSQGGTATVGGSVDGAASAIDAPLL